MDIDISINRKGSDMENTTFGMQASLNPQDGIALLGKAQDKSPAGSQPGQRTSFISVLNKKTAEAINEETIIEKKDKDPDHETINSDFTSIPLLNHTPLGMAHPFSKDTPLSDSEDMKSFPFLDKMKLAVLSIPDAMKTKGYPSEDTQRTAMPLPTKMTAETNQPLLGDPGTGAVTSTFVGISEFIQPQPMMAHQSGENASKAGSLGIKSNLHELMPQTEGLAGQIGQTGKNSAISKIASTSFTEEKASREMDQSTSIPTVGLPDFKAGKRVKSEIPITTENREQPDQAQMNNTVSEEVSRTLDTTVADTPLARLDSTFGNHVTNHLMAEKSRLKTEAGSMDRVSALLRQRDDKLTPGSIFSDPNRTTISHRDNRTDAAAQKEGYVATVTQKPTATNDSTAAIGQSPSEGLSQVELADAAVFMKSSPAGTTAADQDNQHSGTSDRRHRISNGDEFAIHAEMNNILSGSGSRLKASDGPAGINTQAVIDQILDAKQSMNNGFGRVRIILDPPNLGTVNLEIVVRKERIDVVMTADNSGVQQALQSRVDDIRNALQRQDLKIENFQILLQDNGANQQQANNGAMFGQHQEHQARQNLMDVSIPIQPLIQPIRESKPARGLVSIFV
jgi:flagellar hook-length control protein FliK